MRWIGWLSRHFGLTLIIVTLVKVAVAASFQGTVEVVQMQFQAEAHLAGRDVMDRTATGNNPSYFPLGHYAIVSSCYIIAMATGIPYAFVIKLPAILADVLIALLLRGHRRAGSQVALIYLLNPITFLLSAYHGQPHTVALAFGVLALWVAERDRRLLSGVALALAASIRQHFAILIVPLLVRDRKRAFVPLAAFIIVLAIVNSPLAQSAQTDRLMAPTWTYGSWGYTMILKQGPRLLSIAGWPAPLDLSRVHAALEAYGAYVYLTWALVFVLWVLHRRPTDLWRAALVFFVGIYAVAPGFGIQWLVWAVPFWLLVEKRHALVYLALAGAFLSGSYWQHGLNRTYGVYSLTENLGALSHLDLAGVIAVGAFGVLTWGYSGWCLWRLLRRDGSIRQPSPSAALRQEV